ncbi:UNKNOWN [Stylonychia lemnae]|uniref:Uncharacterized protein n=1 Tax=Stylonychia lemnae TaxID=5949 RepID=A0A077ZQ07_STYLE|nr:UNKNOWN [Stylonychia lemnae]|eukprot:CDW71465.1 UNKNOWN [Stylonychia lemnae]
MSHQQQIDSNQCPQEPQRYYDDDNFLIVSFREKFYTKVGIKQLCFQTVKDTLKKNINLLPSKKVNIKFHSTYYGVFELGSHQEVLTAIDILKAQEAILAFEYRDILKSGLPLIQFGELAEFKEMTSFERKFITTQMKEDREKELKAKEEL